jgi:cobalt/nickel transport system ATP-binding protein
VPESQPCRPAPILALEDIYFTYPGGRPLFTGLNFSLNAGERLGLHGPNGSGKTTLFRLITGLEKALAGRVLLRGRTVKSEKDFQALRRRVGLVLQQAEDQLFYPTVLEDVAFGPLNLGLDKEKARLRALETLRQLGLDGYEERLIHKLSGGEKRLAALAAILAMRPEVLLLDEPTNGLDPEAAARITGILQNLPGERITISHDRDFLQAVSNSVSGMEGLQGIPARPMQHVASAHRKE